MTRLSLRNPIAILMISIALMVFAGVVFPRLSVDTFPELTPPVLVVGTQAPGLGPKDVEKTITWRIEKYVSATPGVDHVESQSRSGLSVVYVWFKWGTDLNAAQTLVQQQTAFAMAAVPKSLGVLPPFVLQYDPSNAPVVQVAVYGGGLTGAQLYDYALNNIEPVLEGISGVASASINGGTQRQINITVDPVKAQARGITTSDVSAAVSRSNALLPSGEFLSPKFDANVYTNAVAPKVSAIGDSPVKEVNGRPVLIRDVATVVDGSAPDLQSVSVNGENAVYLNVLRTPGGNTIDIVESVNKALSGLTNLPPGLHVVPIFDQSGFVKSTYLGVRKEILQSLVLIAVVILLFLQSFRGTVIVSVAIPLSFAITFLVMYATGQTLNAFTLGGLTLAMGRLVDNAVVVLESIHRHQKEGLDPYHSALAGANAVALPVLASTITTIAVLLPVVLLTGLAKKLFAPLAMTVTISMIASYFVSMAVTPVACRYLMKHVELGPFAKKVEHQIQGLAERYTSSLALVMKHRAAVLISSSILVVLSLFLAARLPSTFFPEIDEGMERVYVRLAPGASLKESTEKINEMGALLKKELGDDVDLVLTNVGMPGQARSAMNSPNAGPHMGFIRLALADAERRKHSQQEIADHARAVLNSAYPGVEFLQWPGGLVASVFSNGYLAPIALEVRGSDLDDLNRKVRAMAEVARSVPGVRDIYPTIQMDYPEVRMNLDRQEAGMVGVDPRMAAQATLEATLGNINSPSVWVDGSNGQSYYVVTNYDRRDVKDPGGLMQVPVRSAGNGTAVTLGAYGKVQRSAGPVMVERNSLERAAHLLMQAEGRDIGSTASELEKRLKADPRTRDIDFHFVGQVQLMRETFSGLGVAIGLAVMVIFMIMASQFKSLRLPLVMFFTIPVALIGIVLALMAANQGFSITALMGILMVIGIAVSNGILLVDEAKRHLDEGQPRLDAILAAARSRFIPIAMTSLATIIGLLPTAMGLERGAESNQPLALAVVGGLTSSTLLSLFLVPVMFLFFAQEPEDAAASEAAEALGGALPEPAPGQ
ncbi:MAG TPA: efflux RND transporter permease subunit [Holophagaceae bacterium]|nr:efflux RND transporter permease subunit [Holophagaceae bacterium]